MLGRRIAQARERAGLNQSQLAKRLKVSRQVVSAWERRRKAKTPRLRHLRAIARVTSTPIAELLGGASA
ncbi:MAG: helix-turn-helix domain-containing protein [Deltaproteobacteria bacterium]|nr:helix-turn-helix domain-containing protein [Deltaproteobacteria bacterium]